MQYERIGGVVESMQVFELADDLNVSTDALIELLRHMGIPVADDEATITDAQVAKVLAKMERERIAGHLDPAEAVRSAMRDAAPSTGRRRRRRRAVEEVEPDTEEVDEKAGASTSETEESAEDTVVADHSDLVEVEEAAHGLLCARLETFSNAAPVRVIELRTTHIEARAEMFALGLTECGCRARHHLR